MVITPHKHHHGEEYSTRREISVIMVDVRVLAIAGQLRSSHDGATIWLKYIEIIKSDTTAERILKN